MPWIDPVDEFATLPRIAGVPIGPEEWDGTFETVYGVDRVESVTIEGVTIDARDHGTVEILDGALSGVTLETGGSSRFEIVDSTLTGCDLSRARLDSIRGAHLTDCKLAGTNLSEGTVRDARFERCTLSYANLRMSTLDRVAFVDCRLEEVDLYSAGLEDVTVEGGELRSVNVDGARFVRVDLRGARGLDLVGIEDLGGCLITDVQAQQLAIHFALAVGATLERDD